MLRKLSLFLTLAGALSLALACGDNDKGKTGVKLDGSVTQKDTGSTKKDTGGSNVDIGTTKKDTGGTTKDGSSVTVKTCLDIIACVSKCSQGDTTCESNCVNAAPSAAQTTYKAYSTCVSKAVNTGGTCNAKCSKLSDAGTPSTDCSSCVQTACKTEIDACKGPAIQGFGALCDPSSATVTCKTGLECVSTDGKKGWCAPTCTNKGYSCTGVPSGNAAYCALKNKDETKYWCIFLCEIGGTKYPCPTGMTCGTASSGQAFCLP